MQIKVSLQSLSRKWSVLRASKTKPTVISPLYQCDFSRQAYEEEFQFQFFQILLLIYHEELLVFQHPLQGQCLWPSFRELLYHYFLF